MKELFSQISLLYVEDDDDIRPIFERVLRRRVQTLYVATNGEEGYEKYIEHNPDIILTDIKMPKLNGLEMSKKIREVNSKIPIIVLSAHSESDFFIEAIEIGVSGYLVKPVDKEKMFHMLERNIKIVLYEKYKSEQEVLLQNVIDMQPSIVFLENKDKNMLFANKLFLEFFEIEHNSSDTNDKRIYEELKQRKNIRIKDVEEEIFWLDYIFEHDNQSFEVELKKENFTKSFLVKTKRLIRDSDEVAIITLLEI